MRVIVYPHDLDLGGSQLNAIEIAAAVQRAGHPTVVFGRPGALNGRIAELGLEFVEAPEPHHRPSVTVARALRDVIGERGIDIVHGYEWPPALEATMAVRGGRATAIATVMSMAVAPFIPRTVPLLVGTEQIAAAERAKGRLRVDVLEPPVDLEGNRTPPLDELSAFRARWGLSADDRVVACVGRLAHQLKLEGLRSAIRAVDTVADRLRVRLLIVGDGPARNEVAALAGRVNRRHARDVVVLAGELLDPRAAYACADVAIGMGGSALRALAFGRPLVVQGENGFFRLLTPETLPEFLWRGWYGVGDGPARGPGTLVSILEPLLTDAAARRELGAFGRSVVEDRFSLDAAARHQVDVYRSAAQEAPARTERAGDYAVATARFGAHYLRRRMSRLMGRRAPDDFNAHPVAQDGPAAADGPDRIGSSRSGCLVYYAGAPWHAVSGTDRHLAVEIAKSRPVLWVDPPVSLLARWRRGLDIPRVSSVAPGIQRLHTVVPPGVSRPVVRQLARRLVRRAVGRHIGAASVPVAAVFAACPEPVLAGWRRWPITRIYYATDDFLAGAELLGLPGRVAAHYREKNVQAADVVLAVSETLARRLDRVGRRAGVLENGCDPDHYARLDDVRPATTVCLPRPMAGFIGQINERIDVSILESVADTGESLLLIGPRYEQDGRVRERLNRLVDRPNVQWLGRQPYELLPSFMACIDVGLTPYVDNQFNRSSYPLKTLEYLSAGRAVVSTDLPAARSFGSDLVELAAGPSEFAGLVRTLLHHPDAAAGAARRVEFARRHSWSERARAVEDLL